MFDPIFRGPLFGSIFMALTASVMGVFLFVRRESLLGETLSHATYPGIVLGSFGIAFLGGHHLIAVLILIGGFLSAFLATYFLTALQKRKVKTDSALTVILASFFGIGTLLASILQSLFPKELRSIQAYLYGQAATMTDFHIVLYGLLALCVLSVIFFFFKELKLLSFDAPFFQITQGKMWGLECLFIFLTVGGVIIGIRSVGIILLSSMLIAPAVGARQWTDRLSSMLFIAGAIGVLSAFLGSWLSLVISFPTGPLIALTAGFFALCSLLFAPKKGLCIRYVRILRFRWICLEENFLKMAWRGEVLQVKGQLAVSSVLFFLLLLHFKRRGWIEKKGTTYCLTEKGEGRGKRIVRLHRLWEVYLASYLDVGLERVHTSAEEMEHILTPDLEKELTLLLKNPQHDPHDQPIPAGG